MSEHHVNPDGQDPPHALKRGLSQRHIQLIAIGGAIGTGLFMGSGKTINLAGPSIVFVYMIIGAFIYLAMRAMGELLLSNLRYKSFMDMAEDIIGPWAGFFVGWTYWFCWVVTGTADVIAIASYFHFWFPAISVWVPSILVVLLIMGLNLVSVNLFGEMEFWFASIKVMAILVIIAVGVYMVLTGFTSSVSGHTASVANLWEYGGWFPKGALGFFAGFQIALFAFVGIELIGTTAAEAKDPETSLPKAINTIPYRIVFFYVFALLAIMCITPWSDIDSQSSPFVSTFVAVGVPAAASIINFVVLTSAASSANSGIYSTSRMLYGLGLVGVAPRRFGRLSSRRVPADGLLFSCICLLLGASMLIIMPTIMSAFTIMTSVSSVCFVFIWSMIMAAYYVYRKKHPERHAASKFRLPGGLFSCGAVLAFFIGILVLMALEHDTRMALLATPLWFIVLGVGYYCSRKNHISYRKENTRP